MKRNEVEKKYHWDLSAMVDSVETFEKLYGEVEGALSQIEAYKGKLNNRDDALGCLKLDAEVSKKFELIYIYSHMYRDEDSTNGGAVGLASRTEGLAGKYGAAASFISSELGALDQNVLDAYIADPEFSDFDFMLKEVVRQKAHILSDKEEKLLAMAGEALNATYNVAHMLYDADLKFKPVTKDGKKIELNNGSYGELLSDSDRAVRKKAFNNLYDGYIAHINTFAANYAGNVKADNFYAKARGYGDCLEQSLFSDGVPTSVYTNLIEAVNRNLAPLHRYIAAGQKIETA